MNYRLLALCLVVAGCAQQSPTEEGSLIENHSPTAADVKGLLRTAEGPFVRGQVETLTAVFDEAHVRSVSWSATAGALSSRNAKVTWTLPDSEFAELTLTLKLDDGRELVTPFGFSLVEKPENENPHVSRSAREALLTTPMPVLDGGANEISGGACDLAYDATGANIHLAFTTATHPAIYYGRWNGSVWTLEVMDTLGFNTGGRITPGQVQLKLDSTGNPHILYVRDDQAWYATKSGSTWTRERIDNTTHPLGSVSPPMALALNATNRPSVIYEILVSGLSRLVFATRTAANTWTTTMLNFPVGTNQVSRVQGELLFDPAGVAYFPVEVYVSSYIDYLASYNGTTVEVKQVTASGTTAPGWDLYSSKGSSGVWASNTRPLFRTSNGLYDFALATPLANSTYTWSANESSGAAVGDLAWNGRPVMLHHHGGSLELVQPSTTGAAFWTWTQLGVSSGVSGSIAVHPSTGVASICYQAGGRIMFQ
jgi:hypothetical protein